MFKRIRKKKLESKKGLPAFKRKINICSFVGNSIYSNPPRQTQKFKTFSIIKISFIHYEEIETW